MKARLFCSAKLLASSVSTACERAERAPRRHQAPSQAAEAEPLEPLEPLGRSHSGCHRRGVRCGRREAAAHLQVLEIALVADEHHDDRGVRMRAQLLQPALDVLEREALRDVVHEECTDGAAVVGARDGAVALLASCESASRRTRGMLNGGQPCAHASSPRPRLSQCRRRRR